MVLIPQVQPAPGLWYTEPNFGTVVKRLLDKGSNEYSQLQAFSYDEQFIMLIKDGEGHVIYKYPEMTPVIYEKNTVGGWSAPRWIPGTHKIFYLAGQPGRVVSLNVDTNTTTTIISFPEPYLRAAQTFEDPSRDGQWTAVFRYGNGDDLITSLNLVTGKIGAVLSIKALVAGPCAGGASPNWIAPSSLGQYLVIQWDNDGSGRCKGIELYNISTGAFVRQISQRHDHGDQGVSADNREFYLTSIQAGGSKQNNNFPPLVAIWLDGSPMTEVRMLQWGFGHVSCKGPKGVCVVDGIGFGAGDVDEIALVYVPSGDMRRLAFARTSADDYWSQISATFSPSGRRVTWRSDWNVPTAATSVMQIQLPVSP